jgi:predicted nucleotide-binding protein
MQCGNGAKSCAISSPEGDELKKGGTFQAAPRDNVVLEAGYFIRAKGKDRVLIVREAGAKLPADIGGTIYASLLNQQSRQS